MKHFEILNTINCNGKTEKKNGLTYLSWTYAWEEVKKNFPEATYKVVKFNNLPYMFDEKTGYMVFTEVTIEGITHEMWLPVMDGANKSMKDKPYEYSTKYGKKSVEAATMIDINKTIMSCLTKNLAMFGMGLYIYSGEDMPETVEEAKPEQTKPQLVLTDKQIQRLFAIAKTVGRDENAVHEYVKKAFNRDSVKDLTKSEYDKVCEALEKAKKTA
jgi:hypothetical protein